MALSGLLELYKTRSHCIYTDSILFKYECNKLNSQTDKVVLKLSLQDRIFALLDSTDERHLAFHDTGAQSAVIGFQQAIAYCRFM